MENIAVISYQRKHISRHSLMDPERGAHVETIKRMQQTGLTQLDFDIANLRRRAYAHLKIWKRKLAWEQEAMEKLGRVPPLSLRKLAKLARADIRTVKAALSQSFDEVCCQAMEAFRTGVNVLKKRIEDSRALPILILKRQQEAATRKAEAHTLAWEFQKTLGTAQNGLSIKLTGSLKGIFLNRRQSPKRWTEELCSIVKKWKWIKGNYKMDKPKDYSTPNEEVKEPKHPATGLPAGFERLVPLTDRQKEEVDYAISQGWVKPEDCPVVVQAESPKLLDINFKPDFAALAKIAGVKRDTGQIERT